jgi:hypothetical protein
VSKKIFFVALATVVIFALAVAPAFAEGYNDPTEYTRATGYFAGPHGGYTTTTNKCADCHSTHYAAGSFMLMRANSREAACDYCHGGGGGSTINIQMDNAYKTMTADFDYADGVVDLAGAPASGFGTGHTLGYTGEAPADIYPAYQQDQGMACFDCHSPHGNSARILTTFSNPGRFFAAPGQAGRPTTAQVAAGTAWPVGLGIGGMVKGAAGVWSDNGVLDAGEWGVDAEFGNFVWDGNAATAGVQIAYRPIWPNGRFLLVKDPHKTALEGQADTVVTTVAQTAGDLGFEGYNKYKIDWEEPLGPADGTYGGFQDNDNDKDWDTGFPFVAFDGDPTTGGFLSLSEFCVDCHDGTAGASTQAANVYYSEAATYTVAYSHDAQPRH